MGTLGETLRDVQSLCVEGLRGPGGCSDARIFNMHVTATLAQTRLQTGQVTLNEGR